MMVLEYCTNGTLKQYLQSVRNSFDTEIADRLTRIAYGICLGMDYLASREVICSIYFIMIYFINPHSESVEYTRFILFVRVIAICVLFSCEILNYRLFPIHSFNLPYLIFANFS